MIIKTKGIVLSYIKYGDTSIIARVFTEERGYGSYIVNGIRSKKTKKSIGHFQPFSMLDLVLYVKESRDLQRISEFKSSQPLPNISSNMVKSSITLFLTEVLSKLLMSEQHPNHSLFVFVEESIQIFNQMNEGIANFHLQFLLKIGPHLGYAIDDIEEVYRSIEETTPTTQEFERMERLRSAAYGADLPIGRDSRNSILNLILNFYRHHAHISEPKSLNVLRGILS